jgi:hypothetical protein
MAPPTQPLTLTATYLALLQPRQAAPAVPQTAATAATPDPQPASSNTTRGRYVDLLV